MKQIIILCATQRCGSTMIVDDFRSSKVLGLPEEYFIPWTKHQLDDPIRNFKGILNRASTDNGVATIKVMADQLEHIESNLAAIGFCSEEEQVEGYLPHCKKLFQGAKFVRVDRLDSVSQAVSRYMAVQTGKNHLVDASADYVPGNSTDSNRNYNDAVRLDSSKLDEFVISIAKEKSIWDRALRAWDETPLEYLVYEECMLNRDYVSAICNKLGIELNQLGERQLKKIGNANNDVMVNDYAKESYTSKMKSIEAYTNQIRDVGFSLIGTHNLAALTLLKVVKKIRPNSPAVAQKIRELSTNEQK
ncbi:hypothetical protein ST37_04200 [Vibrio sp. qd031]|uniref:Stf0 family sulfotransferase n=1 Tax=Vibrio sp. qd031 TaxID=1603038 RepID=UPI000A10E403|nr:Stf0 family sulfotransferase [Vibrio sp. qd031]ORT51887.1 hypothetical protein ST37_04200 [Vibrio sp. qd031]